MIARSAVASLGTIALCLLPAWSESPVDEGIAELRRLNEAGRYADAEAEGRALLHQAESESGADSLQAAAVLDPLLYALIKGGKNALPETLTFATRALAVRERWLDPGHPEVADSLVGLANLHYLNADYAKALPLYERALRIRETRFGAENVLTARAHVSVGNVLAETGDPPGARLHYEQALAAAETIGATDMVAHSLGSLATILNDMADWDGASELYRRSLEITESLRGSDHPDVAIALDNLSGSLRETGRFEEARAASERALRIREKRLGPDHRLVGMSLMNVGFLLLRIGELDRAGPILDRAILIQERTLGLEHPFVANTLVAKGDLLAAQRDHEGARACYERALNIRTTRLGPDHPLVSRLLIRLARLEGQDGRRGPGLELALRAIRDTREHFLRTAPGLSEREAIDYASILTSGLDTALGLLDGPAGSGILPADVDRVWDAIIRSRAIVLDMVARRHRRVLEADRPAVAGLARDLGAAREKLARLLIRGADPGDSAEYDTRMRAAQGEVDRAERALALESADYRRERAQALGGLDDVRRALPPASALVGFVHHLPLEVVPDVPAVKASGDPRTRYLAFILKAGAARPSAVPLGSRSEIDRLVKEWWERASAPPRSPEDLASYRERGTALRQRVWDPLKRAVGDARQVFLVPEGGLHQVNLIALPSDGKRFLLETGPGFHYLTTERDLLASHAGAAAPSERESSHPRREGGLLVLGGPDFGSVPEPGPMTTPGPPSGVTADAGAPPVETALYRGPLPDCGAFQSLKFASLPGSAAEADEVEALWRRARADGRVAGSQMLKLTGRQAAETAFKINAPGRSVIHLATHGFWFETPCARPGEKAGSKEGRGPPISRGSASRAVPDAGRGSLLLSGLALAGANRRNELPDGAEVEDGVLTAEEVAALDLRDTRWVVLSSCQSGVGPVEQGEGVFGLRRAFQVAGAGTLILSLWPVSDYATRDWMRELYAARFAGATTAAAMRDAALRILEARRREGTSTHPFFWGAFVATGDWQ